MPFLYAFTDKKLMGLFLQTIGHFEMICVKFYSFFDHIGRFIADDERLFYMTGDPDQVVFVESESTIIGLRIFERFTRLQRGFYILLHPKMLESIKILSIFTQPYIG